MKEDIGKIIELGYGQWDSCLEHGIEFDGILCPRCLWEVQKWEVERSKWEKGMSPVDAYLRGKK